MFHEHEGPVHNALEKLLADLSSAGMGHVVIGAFALACYNYERATSDVDVCLRESDLNRFRSELVGTEYEPVQGRSRRFQVAGSRVTVDLLISGELAGRTSRNDQIRFPDPDEAVVVNGIPTVTLPRLIELKLVTWRLQDWADVVALIRNNNLTEDFSTRIHPLVRMAYLECYDQKAEEDRYTTEH